MNGLQSLPTRTSSTLGQVYLGEQHTYRSSQWSDVIFVSQLSQWQVQGIKKLVEIMALPQNWDSYGSPPPSQGAVSIAIELLMGIDLDYFLSPRVVPVAGGGVQLEWSLGTREVELEVLDDGSVEYLRIEDGQPFDEGQISPINLGMVRSLLTWLISLPSER